MTFCCYQNGVGAPAVCCIEHCELRMVKKHGTVLPPSCNRSLVLRVSNDQYGKGIGVLADRDRGDKSWMRGRLGSLVGLETVAKREVLGCDRN